MAREIKDLDSGGLDVTQCDDFSLRDRYEDTLWEDLLNGWSRSPSPQIGQEFQGSVDNHSLRTGLTLNERDHKNLPRTYRPTVVRYTDVPNGITAQEKPSVPDSGCLSGIVDLHNSKVVSRNYRPNCKYDRQFTTHSIHQSRKSSMKRGMHCPDSKTFRDSAQTVQTKLASGQKRLIDVPLYVREALGAGHDSQTGSNTCTTSIPKLMPNSDRQVKTNSDILETGISKRSLDEPSVKGNQFVNSETALMRNKECDKVFSEYTDADNVDDDDAERWVSGNSLVNVTSWMIRNQEHLQKVLNTVSDKPTSEFFPEDVDDNVIGDTAGYVEESHLNSGDLSLDGSEVMKFSGKRLDTSFQESILSSSSFRNLREAHAILSPRTSGSSRTTIAPCSEVDAVRSNFYRMRMQYRDRRDSMRSTSSRLLSRQASSRSSVNNNNNNKEGDDDSTKCYLEIVGSNISPTPDDRIPTPDDRIPTPTGSVSSMEGSPRGTDSSSQVQSLSELAIIENMADLLNDIEKSDLVLADNLGWLHHLQSGKDRWCVIADIIMCVFENQDTNKPVLSILLPGADIHTVYNPKDIPGNKSHITRNKNSLKFGIAIDSNIAGQEHTFFARNEDDYTTWMNSLKMASEFDQDDPVDRNSHEDYRLNKECTSPFSGLSPSDSYNFNPLSRNETGIELEMSLGSQDSPVTFSQRNHRHLDLQNSCSDLSLQSESSNTSKESGISMLDSTDLKKLLRGEIRENGHSSPLHTSSSTQDIFLSPPKSLSLDRRYFKSMDQLDQLILGKTMLNSRGSNQEINRNKNTSVTMESVTQRKSQSLRRPLSQSMDLSKIAPLTSGLVRKASGIKEKMFGRKGKSLQNITLGSLGELKMSGFLQHKILLKWQKLFCAISKGCFYAFKTKEDSETPEFVAILSNYTITYLLSDRQKKHKSSKQFVFKLTQPNRKSIYLCAPHSLDLARWIQVMQMEANKVSVDNPELNPESFDRDSWGTPDLFPNTNAKYPLGSSVDDLNDSHFFQDGFQASEKLSSTCVSESLEVVSTEQGRVTVSHHVSHQNDNEIIAAWDDTSSSSSTIYSSTLDSNSTGDIDNTPRYDDAVRQVWQNDHRYRFSAVRKHAQRLKNTFSDRRNKVPCKIIIDDMSDESSTKQDENSDVQREVIEDVLETKKTSGQSSTPGPSPSVPKRHKPLTVRQLPVSQLDNPDYNGYLEKRHQDGSWIRYWFCLKSGWMYCYLTPSDLLTADTLELKQCSVTCRVEKFPSKPYVIELSNKRFFSIYLAADSEANMTEWTNQIESGIASKMTNPPPPPPSRPEDLLINTGLLSDDSSVADDSSNANDDDRSGAANSSLSQARQHLLEQVLKLKHDLERKKSETDRKRGLHASKSVPAGLDLKGQEEKLVHEITSLRQRRLSTQLKVDTLHRHMEINPTSTVKKKPLFRFGGRQKSPTESLRNSSPFMEEQVRELTDRLEVIDKDLTHRQNRRSLNTRWLDLANNNPDAASGFGNRLSPSPENQGRNLLFAGKGQSDSKRSQSMKLSTSKSLEIIGQSDDGTSTNHTSTNHTAERLIGSVTTLTESVSPLDGAYSLAKLNKGKNWFWRRKSEKESKISETAVVVQSTNQITSGFDETDFSVDSPKISPRREINPQVLADIEEFEELSRTALRRAQDSDLMKKVVNTS